MFTAGLVALQRKNIRPTTTIRDGSWDASVRGCARQHQYKATFVALQICFSKWLASNPSPQNYSSSCIHCIDFGYQSMRRGLSTKKQRPGVLHEIESAIQAATTSICLLRCVIWCMARLQLRWGALLQGSVFIKILRMSDEHLASEHWRVPPTQATIKHQDRWRVAAMQVAVSIKQHAVLSRARRRIQRRIQSEETNNNSNASAIKRWHGWCAPAATGELLQLSKRLHRATTTVLYRARPLNRGFNPRAEATTNRTFCYFHLSTWFWIFEIKLFDQIEVSFLFNLTLGSNLKSCNRLWWKMNLGKKCFTEALVVAEFSMEQWWIPLICNINTLWWADVRI